MKEAKIGDLVKMLGIGSEILDYGIIVAEKPHARGNSDYHMIKIHWFGLEKQTDWIWRNLQCLEKIA